MATPADDEMRLSGEVRLGDPICCEKCGKWRRPFIGAAANFDACQTDSCKVMSIWQRLHPSQQQLSNLPKADPKGRLLVIRELVNDMVRNDIVAPKHGRLTFKDITKTLSKKAAAKLGRDYSEEWLRAQIDDRMAKHKANGRACALVNHANRQRSATDLQRAVGPSGLLDVLDNDMLLIVLMASGIRGTIAAWRTCRRLRAIARAAHKQPTLTVLQGDNTIACALYAARLVQVKDLRIEREGAPGDFEMFKLQILRTPPWMRTPPTSTGQPHRVRLAWKVAKEDVVLSPLGALYLGAALAIDVRATPPPVHRARPFSRLHPSTRPRPSPPSQHAPTSRVMRIRVECPPRVALHTRRMSSAQVHTTSEADLGREGMHTENYYSGLEAGGVLMGLDRARDEQVCAFATAATSAWPPRPSSHRHICLATTTLLARHPHAPPRPPLPPPPSSPSA